MQAPTNPPTNRGGMTQVPYALPSAVEALGKSERIFLPSTQVCGANKTLAALLLIPAAGCLGIAGMLFYCAVHPFGTSPPSPTVCWIAGTGLVVVTCATAFGAYYYFSGAGDNKQAYLVYPTCLVELFPDKHRIIPWETIGTAKATGPVLKTFRFPAGPGSKDIAFDYSLPNHDELAALIVNRGGSRAVSAAASRTAAAAPASYAAPGVKTSREVAAPVPQMQPSPEKTSKLRMETALRTEPPLQQRMGALIEALCSAAPDHYAMLHLLVEARKTNGQISVLFTHGSPVLLNEYSTVVPDSISNAAFSVVDWWLHQDDNFPGFEVVLRKTASRKWDVDARRLDERAAQWPKMPRYPIRICGYGLSLAPPPDTVFRWQHNANPPGIIASTLNPADPKKSPRRVQVILSEAGHQLGLGHEVEKAEEVIQISEGPRAEQWTIETPIFRTVWPAGLDLRYPLASKTRFDLLGPDDAIVFVQSPVADDPQILDTMRAEGQTEVARGKTSAGHPWIELAYEFQGSKWRQRHYARAFSPQTCFVVTAQSLRPAAEGIFRASDDVTNAVNSPAG